VTDGYAKLFGSILDSTIWGEDSDTRIVWITMMAMAGPTGYVGATIPGIARRAGVTVEKCDEAITKFLGPDKYSRTPDLEGRRLVRTNGGFTLVNYVKYRNMLAKLERAEYQADWAKNKRRQLSTESTQAEAEANIGSPSSPPKRRRGRPRSSGLTPFPDGWQPTEAHAKRATETGLDLKREAESFESWHKSKGSVFSCWNSAFTTWLIKALDFRGDKPASYGTSKPSIPDQRELRRRATVAWNAVSEAVRRYGAHRLPPPWEDPLTADLVARIGWRNVCLGDDTDNRIRFCDAYQEMARRESRDD
jgi:hypothetical protein